MLFFTVRMECVDFKKTRSITVIGNMVRVAVSVVCVCPGASVFALFHHLNFVKGKGDSKIYM